MKWEYKVVLIHYNPRSRDDIYELRVTSALNDLAGLGWEVVTCICTGLALVYTLKRPKPPKIQTFDIKA